MKSYAPAVFLFLCIVIHGISCSMRHQRERQRHCRKCPPGWGVKKACNSIANTVCERCVPGETYSPEHSHTSSCWRCSRCGVGLYEAHECSITRDTICDDCTRVIFQPSVVSKPDFNNTCSYIFRNKPKSRFRASATSKRMVTASAIVRRM